ncbi:hypothetical protein DE146DRAFT_333642 [Phaeosphaeria sp. MPI-PUGE-AT-0046c]|nr:hypothetical protein DE146DRAFT_333642 [Phaeosphaeria sp. MPI-PUGE-AT-0046c]
MALLRPRWAAVVPVLFANSFWYSSTVANQHRRHFVEDIRLIDWSEVADSLESIHDTLHNTLGDRGHMWKTLYAAFDPIFWLLHANTDRMLAIWQNLNPDSYVTNQSNPKAAFTTPSNSWADENTPLHPFHRDEAGNFWTSSSVRNHKVFGYTYPELINLPENTTLTEKVNALYGGNAKSQFSWDLDQRPGSADIGHQRDASQYYYFASIHVTSRVSNMGYKVYVFLDDIPADSQASDTDEVHFNSPGLVGFAGFQSTVSAANELTQANDDKTMGVIALTKSLEDKVRLGHLASMDEVAVRAYLQKEMTWRIAVGNDQMLPAKEASTIEIEVLWAKMTPSTPDSFPKFLSQGFQLLMRATGGVGAEAWDRT